jgi:addiction module RelE/StbE family toxin
MSSKYNLEFSSQARKFLKKIKEKRLLEEFSRAFELLCGNPYLGKFLQANLKGYHSYRIHRVYRIIYKILHHKLLIFIEDIAHRKESY